MKSFYEMMRLMEGHVIGEDHDDPFSGEIHISGSRQLGDWEWSIEGSFFALGYSPNGSENPISKPVYHPGKFAGTEFGNPGDRLQNLPEPLRSEAIKWVNEQFEKIIEREDGTYGFKPHYY